MPTDPDAAGTLVVGGFSLLMLWLAWKGRGTRRFPRGTWYSQRGPNGRKASGLFAVVAVVSLIGACAAAAVSGALVQDTDAPRPDTVVWP